MTLLRSPLLPGSVVNRRFFSTAIKVGERAGTGAEAGDEGAYRVTLSTVEELRTYVGETWGVWIPNEACCEDHQAPMDAFAASYFGEDPVVIWHASRGLGGKTVLLALLSLTEATTLGAGVTLLGGSGEQSTRVLQYMQGLDPNLLEAFWNAPGAPRELLKKEVGRRTLLRNGGQVTALMASTKSVRGPHPQRVRLDECLAGWTEVPTDRGILPINEICRGDLIWGWNGAILTRGVVRHSRYMGTRPTFTIRFDNGATITGTGNHRILGIDGAWIRIDELDIGAPIVAAPMQRVPRAAPRASTQQNRALPCLLGRGETEGEISASALSRLWNRDWLEIEGMPELLPQAARGEEGALRGLRQGAEAAEYGAVSAVLSDLPEQGRDDPSNGGGEGHGSQDAGANLSGGAADGGVAGYDGRHVRAVGSDGSMDRRLRSATRAGSDRGPRRLLARQAGRGRPRSAQARRARGAGMDGAVRAHGPDAQVVRVIGIDAGPTVPVYDLTIPRLNSFLAASIVVHNCDEMDMAIYTAATGQAMGRVDDVTGKRIAGQMTLSSTWHEPDGTMTFLLKEARKKRWPVFQWCYKENLHGWLDEETLAEKRAQVTKAVFEVEFDLQEPSPERRAMMPEAMALTFKRILGEIDVADDWVGELTFEEPAPEGLYATGTDWAKDVDWTWILTYRVDRHPIELVAVRRCGRLPWPLMVEYHCERVKKYGGQSSHDATGVGKVVADYLTVDSEAFTFVGKERTDLLSDYLLAMEHGKIVNPVLNLMYAEHKFADNAALFSQAKHLPDTIAAGALAWRAAVRARGADIGTARKARARARKKMRERS